MRKILGSVIAGMILILVGASACAQSKSSTASGNVQVLAPIPMPGLERERTLRIYLPPGYATSDKRYPVLYMHDAQNLFDAATSYAGEWEVDETLDALAKSGGLELIVVGIDNGGDKRINELLPWPSPRFNPAHGGQYMAFVVGTVKPLIDARFRTLPDRANTAIMGSSLGGLISHYAIHQYPQVFSKAGVFSPSYWIAPQVYEFSGSHTLPPDSRMYILVGGKEGEDTVPNVQRMTALELANGLPASNLQTLVVPNGEHNEALWRSEFRAAVLWLFARPAKTP
jgi:alpha-glucosidase